MLFIKANKKKDRFLNFPIKKHLLILAILGILYYIIKIYLKKNLITDNYINKSGIKTIKIGIYFKFFLKFGIACSFSLYFLVIKTPSLIYTLKSKNNTL
jgi:hypothetical protein